MGFQLEVFHVVAVKMLAVMSSSKGSAGPGASASKMAHSRGRWQEGFSPHHMGLSVG